MSGEKLSIIEAFYENKFNLFVRYCAQKNLFYVDELESTNFDFDSLNDIKGMGDGKIKSIKERYEKVLSQNQTSKIDDEIIEPISKKSEPKGELIFKVINEELKSFDIDYLIGLGIKTKLVDELKNRNLYTVGDLANITDRELKQIVGYNGFDKLISIKENLSVDLKTSFEISLRELSKSDDFQMVLFRAEGFTLKEIGELKNITRERSRQVINKMLSRMDSFMNLITESLLTENGFFSEQTIFNFYDNEDFNNIIFLWCKASESLTYLKFAGKFLPAEIKFETIKTDLLKIADEIIGEGIELSNISDNVEESLNENGYGYLSVEDFTTFLLENGYKRYNDFVVKGRQSYGWLCARVIGKYFKNGFKLYEDEELKKLRELVLTDFGDIGVPDENRALSTRISEFTVLCGRGCVTSTENVYIEASLLNEIYDFIEKATEAQIYYAELYSRFENKLSLMSNVTNYYFLHGVLKLYYSEVYDFSNRDYLSKRGEGFKSGKLSDKLHDLIIKENKLISKSEIKETFPGLSEIALVNAIASGKDLIQWEYNTFYSLDLMQISNEDIESLKLLIKAITDSNGGYCSDRLLFDLASEQIPEFLNINNIQKPMPLFYVCAKLLSDFYDFRRPHITEKGLFDSLSLKDIALHFLKNPDIISYDEFVALSKKMKWADTTVNVIFLDIQEEYIRISADKYIRKNLFVFEKNIITEIEKAIRNDFKNGFVAIDGINNWQNYPDLGIEWNSNLLKSFVNIYIYSLKIIEPDVKDRRYEKGIVMDKLNPVNDYTTLVSNFLKLNNISEISEIRLRDLLISNKLANQSIPKELYSCSSLEYKDEKFIVK